ncbi:MAG: prephenate dehydrogenase [Candidatus Dormibacteria bacterium]
MSARVGIVGLGLLGGSLGLALRRQGIEVLGLARRDATVAEALKAGAVSFASADPVVLEGADLVVVAVPLGDTEAVLASIAPHLAPGARVTDVGSVKTSVLAAASRTLDPARNPFLGGHPMAGKEVGGIGHADADLFRGHPWILTPVVTGDPGEGPPVGFEDLWEIVTAIGARPRLVSAADHDRQVALVSHLPFLLSAVYLVAAGGRPDWEAALGVASSGFRDFSRLGAGDPEMYAAICNRNQAAIRDGLAALRAVLESVDEALTPGAEAGQEAALATFFASARALRRQWDEVKATGTSQ